jgi:hypothetical protein
LVSANLQFVHDDQIHIETMEVFLEYKFRFKMYHVTKQKRSCIHNNTPCDLSLYLRQATAT